MSSLRTGIKSKKRSGPMEKKISSSQKIPPSKRAFVSQKAADDIPSMEAGFGAPGIQKTLEKREEEFRTLAENAPDIIMRFDRDCRHRYVNVRAEQVLGIPRDAIIGKTQEELGYSQDLVRYWKKKIGEVFSTKEKRVIEYSFPSSSGEIYFESVLVPESDIQGNVVSVLSLSRDVTHFIKTERKIKELNAQLEAQAKDLREINQELVAFTHAVSHDLKAPLRSIAGFTEAIEENFSSGLPDEAKDYLRRANLATRKMGQLIDSLLVLSRVGRKEIETDMVDLSRMAKDFLEDLRRSQPEREVEFVIKKDLKVRGDPRLLEVAMQNLLRNAWKFTGGRSPARIEFGMDEEGGKKVFFIKDNGVGFDMSYADKLFTPFQRLHSSNDFPGAGVGLSTVKRIVVRHNGRIWADAEVGKGAVFYFYIQGGGNEPDGK